MKIQFYELFIHTPTSHKALANLNSTLTHLNKLLADPFHSKSPIPAFSPYSVPNSKQRASSAPYKITNTNKRAAISVALSWAETELKAHPGREMRTSRNRRGERRPPIETLTDNYIYLHSWLRRGQKNCVCLEYIAHTERQNVNTVYYIHTFLCAANCRIFEWNVREKRANVICAMPCILLW